MLGPLCRCAFVCVHVCDRLNRNQNRSAAGRRLCEGQSDWLRLACVCECVCVYSSERSISARKIVNSLRATHKHVFVLSKPPFWLGGWVLWGWCLVIVCNIHIIYVIILCVFSFIYNTMIVCFACRFVLYPLYMSVYICIYIPLLW